jgi:hypothetical protein
MKKWNRVEVNQAVIRFFPIFADIIEQRMLKKVFSILMALCIMVLVFAPCVDQELYSCSRSGSVISSETIPVHQDQHDSCSPFCTCSCCSAPFELMKAFVISTDFPHYESLTFFFTYPFQSRTDFTIWEPPKA